MIVDIPDPSGAFGKVNTLSLRFFIGPVMPLVLGKSNSPHRASEFTSQLDAGQSDHVPRNNTITNRQSAGTPTEEASTEYLKTDLTYRTSRSRHVVWPNPKDKTPRIPGTPPFRKMLPRSSFMRPSPH